MYTYTPLRAGDDNRFRVMMLLPGQWESRLQCTIDEVSLKEGLEYEALSYTWQSSKFDADDSMVKSTGSSEADHAADKQYFIYCNEQRIKIGLSLQNLLKMLRSECNPRTLWADQICIDQDNIPEIGAQVKIMRNIYAEARWSLLWTVAASSPRQPSS
jgi:hypothetical protein